MSGIFCGCGSGLVVSGGSLAMGSLKYWVSQISPKLCLSIVLETSLILSHVTDPAHSSLCKENPADLMLLSFVWDETASETARSQTENRKYTFHSIPYVASCCPRGSLVPYKNKEQVSCAVHFLCCSSLSQMQFRPIQKWGESVPPGPSFARNGCPDDVTYQQ